MSVTKASPCVVSLDRESNHQPSRRLLLPTAPHSHKTNLVNRNFDIKIVWTEMSKMVGGENIGEESQQLIT